MKVTSWPFHWLLAAGLGLAAPLNAGATYLIWSESDPGGLNNVGLTTFATLADLKTLSNPTSQTPFFGFPSGVSVGGLAFDGSQYLLWSESDPGGLNNVGLTTFATLADLKTLSNPTSQTPFFGFPSGVSVGGLAFDGSQYLLWIESDPGGLNNVGLTTFATLADLKTLSNPTSQTPFFGFPSGVSVGGLAFDGSQYLLWSESDPGGLNNVGLTTFATLADLKTLSNPTSQTPFFGFPSGVSIRGLAYVPDPIADIPEPSTFALLTIGLAGLGFGRLKHG